MLMNKFMQAAIEEALKTDGEIPVGAVLVKDNKIIARTHNTKEKDNDITSHAEILAIKQAERVEGNWRLDGYELYVTLEPCPMCGWAILQSRIGKVYFGSYDMQYGAFCSKIDLRKLGNSKTQIFGGIMEEECDKILKDFFVSLRG